MRLLTSQKPLVSQDALANIPRIDPTSKQQMSIGAHEEVLAPSPRNDPGIVAAHPGASFTVFIAPANLLFARLPLTAHATILRQKFNIDETCDER